MTPLTEEEYSQIFAFVAAAQNSEKGFEYEKYKIKILSLIYGHLEKEDIDKYFTIYEDPYTGPRNDTWYEWQLKSLKEFGKEHDRQSQR